ncbi:hypothetical protein J3Q64DRAFT_1728346 [Phycomyces blakesleeanus]|uniref:Survival motor neuron Tudor domain-containing protein n=1 Tax=Phycomyces blakesleeanus TaxID=4837 RepID=A0ABR3B824_PHYBL
MDSQSGDLRTGSSEEGDLWNDIDLIKYWDTALSGYKQHHSKDNVKKLGELCPDPSEIPRSNPKKRQVPADILAKKTEAKRTRITASVEIINLPNDNQGLNEGREQESLYISDDKKGAEEKQEQHDLNEECYEEEEEEYEEEEEEGEGEGEQEEQEDEVEKEEKEGYQDQGQSYYNHLPHQAHAHPSMPYYSSHSYHAPENITHPAHTMPTMPPMPPMPQRSNGSSQDDEMLSNLMMAWYYSGYYTGLYQARRS